MVNQDSPHHFGRQREEVRPILPIGVALADEPEIGLVHQSGGLKDMPRRFMSKSGCRPPAQFLIDDADQLVSRLEISASPRVQQSRHVVVRNVQIAHK